MVRVCVVKQPKSVFRCLILLQLSVELQKLGSCCLAGDHFHRPSHIFILEVQSSDIYGYIILGENQRLVEDMVTFDRFTCMRHDPKMETLTRRSLLSYLFKHACIWALYMLRKIEANITSIIFWDVINTSLYVSVSHIPTSMVIMWQRQQ